MELGRDATDRLLVQENVLLSTYLSEDHFCVLGIKMSDVLFSTTLPTFARCPSFLKFLSS
jgi:hypothetical protein